VSYAYEKRIYTSSEARKAYVDKIRGRYVAMKKPEKAENGTISVIVFIIVCTIVQTDALESYL
jgi:hypothetical protein